VSVKEFQKWVDIWWSYDKKLLAYFFYSQCIWVNLQSEMLYCTLTTWHLHIFLVQVLNKRFRKGDTLRWRLAEYFNDFCRSSLCWSAHLTLSLPSNRRHLSCDDCLEDKREDCWEMSCAVLCTAVVHNHACSFSFTLDLWALCCAFLHHFYRGSVCLFCGYLFVFFVFSFVCFEPPCGFRGPCVLSL